MANPSIPVKQGQTFSYSASLQQNDGTPVDISAATVAFAVRDASSNLLATGTVTPALATGSCVLSLTPAQTAALPIGLAFVDVEYSLPGGVFYSDTFSLIVSAPITGGGG